MQEQIGKINQDKNLKINQIYFALKYFIDKKDDANIKVKEFIVSKKFLETVTELIVIILGATIAINFTNIQEKKENRNPDFSYMKVHFDEFSVKRLSEITDALIKEDVRVPNWSEKFLKKLSQIDNFKIL